MPNLPHAVRWVDLDPIRLKRASHEKPPNPQLVIRRSRCLGSLGDHAGNVLPLDLLHRKLAVAFPDAFDDSAIGGLCRRPQGGEIGALVVAPRQRMKGARLGPCALRVFGVSS